MGFNRRSKRFGSRFSNSMRAYQSGLNGKRGNGKTFHKVMGHASNFGGLIRSNYESYLNSLQLHSRNSKERFVLLGFTAVTAFLGSILFASAAMSVFLPSVRDAQKLLNVESTIFYDRNGKVLYTVHGEENREVIKSEDIPQVVKNAAVAIEDDGFYDHRGFDIPAILKAVLSEIGIGERRGGSTITQQFVKNAILSNERTYTRKFKEIVLATRLERRYSKDEILTMYLNKIPYGGTAYGVEKAAEVFFNKNAKELNLTEAVILASLPQAPTYYSPFGANKYSSLKKTFTADELERRDIETIRDLEETEYSFGLIGKSYLLANGKSIYLPGRTDEVLRRMEELGYISKEERDKTLPLVQAYEFNDYITSFKAPHFVLYVKKLLTEKYGKELVENGGLKVYTTLDYDLYEEGRKILTEQAKLNRARYKATNAALVSIDPSNGQVLSLIGSAGYNDKEIGGANDMATEAEIQPGSSFKPIVYAAAFLKNVGPGTVFYDVPTKIGEDTPKNYDGSFSGPMTARRALAQSRNIPAIKSYYLAGQQDAIITLAESMGISTLDRRLDYGWPLSLGTGEVKMIDMAEAFGVFANGGYRVDINPILKVVDSEGEVLEDYTVSTYSPKKSQVLDPQVAYLINNILSDRSNNLGGALNLPDGRVSAIKTGTSTKRIENVIYPTNLWAVGYTPQLVTAVWSGNADGTELALSADGYNASVPIWNKYMSLALEDEPKVDFVKPKGITSVQISKLSGKLPSQNTPESMITTDIFASFSVPTQVDDSFLQTKVDIRNKKKPNAFCPPDFVKDVTIYNPQAEIPGFLNWQSEIVSWFSTLDEEKSKELNFGENVIIGAAPTEESELCKQEFAAKFLDVMILDYMNGDVIPKGPFTVTTSAEAEAGIEKVEFFLDDELRATATSAPYTAELRVPVGFRTGRTFKVRAKVIDRNGYSKNYVLELVTGDRPDGLAAEENVE